MVDAARELFLDGGEEAVTLRRVADKIEYSATTIYQHFPSKEALIQELCAVDFEGFSRMLKQAERLPDPLARLRKVSLCYADFGLQYPRHYRSMFMASHRAPQRQPSDGGKNGALEAKPPSPYNYLSSAVFKAMAAGCFHPEHRDVPLITQILWGGLHGVVSLHLERARFPDVIWRSTQETLETMVDLLLHGLTGQTSPANS